MLTELGGLRINMLMFFFAGRDGAWHKAIVMIGAWFTLCHSHSFAEKGFRSCNRIHVWKKPLIVFQAQKEHSLFVARSDSGDHEQADSRQDSTQIPD